MTQALPQCGSSTHACASLKEALPCPFYAHILSAAHSCRLQENDQCHTSFACDHVQRKHPRRNRIRLQTPRRSFTCKCLPGFIVFICAGLSCYITMFAIGCAESAGNSASSSNEILASPRTNWVSRSCISCSTCLLRPPGHYSTHMGSRQICTLAIEGALSLSRYSSVATQQQLRSLQRNVQVIAWDSDATPVANLGCAIQFCIAVRQRPIYRWRHPETQEMPLSVHLLQMTRTTIDKWASSVLLQ